MVIIPPSKPFRKNKKRLAIGTPGPVPLVLVSAGYSSNVLTLQFDRPVNIDLIDLSQFTVDDGVVGHTVLGDGFHPQQPDPVTVLFDVSEQEAYDGSQVLLNASADTGIVAVDDGGTWAGVSGMVIG